MLVQITRQINYFIIEDPASFGRNQRFGFRALRFKQDAGGFSDLEIFLVGGESHGGVVGWTNGDTLGAVDIHGGFGGDCVAQTVLGRGGDLILARFLKREFVGEISAAVGTHGAFQDRRKNALRNVVISRVHFLPFVRFPCYFTHFNLDIALPNGFALRVHRFQAKVEFFVLAGKEWIGFYPEINFDAMDYKRFFDTDRFALLVRYGRVEDDNFALVSIAVLFIKEFIKINFFHDSRFAVRVELRLSSFYK